MRHSARRGARLRPLRVAGRGLAEAPPAAAAQALARVFARDAVGAVRVAAQRLRAQPRVTLPARCVLAQSLSSAHAGALPA